MKEEISINKTNIIISVVVSFLMSIIIGSSIGLKLDNLGWGISAGIITLIIHISTLLIIYSSLKKISWYVNYIPLLFVLLIFLVTIFFVPNVVIEPINSKKIIPSHILYYLDKWNFHASLMRIVQTMLALISIVCSLLVAMQINHYKSKTIKWIAFVSALSIGILSTFSFGEKANSFRTAWRMLNTAVIKYESIPDYSVEELINVYDEAEKIIANVKINIE